MRTDKKRRWDSLNKITAGGGRKVETREVNQLTTAEQNQPKITYVPEHMLKLGINFQVAIFVVIQKERLGNTGYQVPLLLADGMNFLDSCPPLIQRSKLPWNSAASPELALLHLLLTPLSTANVNYFKTTSIFLPKTVPMQESISFWTVDKFVAST